MNASGKGLVALYLHRRGEQWVWQSVVEQEEERQLSSLQDGGILHFRNTQGVLKTAVIFSIEKGMVGLSRAIKAFEDNNMNLVHIESRNHPTKEGELEVYLEINSQQSSDWNTIQHLVDTLKGIDLSMCDNGNQNFLDSSNMLDYGDMVRFPKCIGDLDSCQKVLMYGTDLDADHPGRTSYLSFFVNI